MKRVSQPSPRQKDSALFSRFPVRILWFKLSALVLVIFFFLAWAVSSKAASVQIKSGSAQNMARALVRTISGNLYAVILDTSSTATVRVYESTNGGTTWAQQDIAHAPSGANYRMPSAAIDGNGVIHIAYWNSTSSSTGLRYVTFSTTTNLFSGDVAVVGTSNGQPAFYGPSTSIAVDSNNAPHVLYSDYVKSGSHSFVTTTYIDKVGSTWNAKVRVYGAANSLNTVAGDILINQNNVPEVTFVAFESVGAAIGNANKATSFTTQLIGNYTIFTSQIPSIVLDNANNTWVAYAQSILNSSQVVPALIQHKANDPWTTWQALIQDSAASVSDTNPSVALAGNGTTLYLAYPSSAAPNNVVWESYNGSSWSTIASLDHASSSPVLKWSQYFNNGGSNQTDILITSSLGAYWNKITATIGSLSPSAGPVGTAVTINGSNFGSSQGTSTVTFNGVTVTPSSWSANSIIVTTPAFVTSGPVVVNVGGVESNAVNFTVLVPSISSLSVQSGSTGTPVTINGSNFGTSQGTSTVTFNGILASPSSWSSSAITTTVPGGANSGPVIVTVNGASSNGFNFTVLYPPNISSLSPNTGPAGTLVTVAGTNFGETQGTSTTKFNGTAAVPLSWSTTSIAVPVPGGATTGSVVVTVGGTSSNGVTFTVVPATLQITSPPSGTVVAPGQSISLSVASPDGTTFTAVAVVPQDPFDFSTLQTSLPAQFSFIVPTQIACRSYAFTAVGSASSGQNVESVPILIDVERPDLPTSISPSIPRITLGAPGERAPFVLLATFADGSVLDVSRSSNVVYSSTNPSVATIDANGIVTAISPGTTFVTAVYTATGKSIPRAIPVSVSTPYLNPSVFSLVFGSQSVGTTSPSQSVTLSNMASAPVQIVTLRTTGDFSETDNCLSASPLPVGGSCVVNITFAPTAIGTRPGKLLIFNGSDPAPTAVVLTGLGTSP